MQFTTFAVFAVSALTAFAAPTEMKEGSTAPAQVNASPCKNDQVQSCCNGDSNIPVLGGNCFIPLVSGQCTGNQFCCQTEQDGLINVGSICLPITL